MPRKSKNTTEIIIPTKIPGVNVCVHHTLQNNGQYNLSGYLVGENNEMLECAKVRRTTAKSVETLDQKIDIIVERCIHQKSPSPKRKKSKSTILPNNAFNIAFSDVMAFEMPVYSRWNKSTSDSHTTYFRRNILPVLAEYDGSAFLEEDRLTLAMEIQRKVLANGRSSKAQTTATRTTEVHLAAADKIYERMRDLHPELPKIRFSSGFSIGKYQPESAKSLPDRCRKMLVKKIEELADSDPDYAIRLICMVEGGARNAEACGVSDDDFVFFNNYALLQISKQVASDNSGTKDELKTLNGYRTSIIDYWGTALIKKALSNLGGSLSPYLSLNLFAARTYSTLTECGCNDDFFAAARELMDAHPEYNVSEDVSDEVTTYVLRRDFSSRAKNICGLTNDEIDALLGHKRAKWARKNSVELSNKDSQIGIAQKLERYVSNPNITLNPKYNAVMLDENSDYNFIPYDGYRFTTVGDKKLFVDISVVSSEPGEPIDIVVKKQNVNSIDPGRQVFKPENRIIIGKS